MLIELLMKAYFMISLNTLRMGIFISKISIAAEERFPELVALFNADLWDSQEELERSLGVIQQAISK